MMNRKYNSLIRWNYLENVIKQVLCRWNKEETILIVEDEETYLLQCSDSKYSINKPTYNGAVLLEAIQGYGNYGDYLDSKYSIKGDDKQ